MSLMKPTATTPASGRGRDLVEGIEAIGLLVLVIGAVLALAVAIVPAMEALPAAPQAAEIPPAAPAEAIVVPDSFAVTADTSLVFRLQIGSRLYPDWKEERAVRLQERFIIGDTENVGVVRKLLPDFRIVEGKPRSVSRDLGNPAVRVFVSRGDSAVDSTWAFLNFPPHFSPKSFFTFQLKEITGYEAGEVPARKPEPEPEPEPASAAGQGGK
jgi:hypothetical protein